MQMEMRKNIIKTHRRILFTCLIITISVVLSSCGLQKSVRTGSYNSYIRAKSNYASENQKATNRSETKVEKNESNSIATENISPEKAGNNFPVAGERITSTNFQEKEDEYKEFLQQKIEKLEEEIAYLRKEIGLLYQLIEEQNTKVSVEQKVDKSKVSNKSNKATKTAVNHNTRQVKHQSNVSRAKTQKDVQNDRTEAKATEPKQTSELQKLNSNKNLEEIVSLIKDKRYDDALSKIEKQLQVENELGNLSNLWYWQGEALFMKKDYQRALESFRKVLSVPKSSKRSESQIMIAECFTRLGKLSEAKKEYQKFIEEYPFSEFAPRAKRMLQQL
jgi:TolA-binding protein